MADQKRKGEENVEDFLGHLYTDICTEARWAVELPDIIDATKELVKRIVAEAYGPNMEKLKSEGVTNIDVLDVGSMAEGTKICNPDEFDFVISFTYSSAILKTFPSSNENNISFLKYTAEPGDPRFRQIDIGKNKILPPLKFMERNYKWLKSALLEVGKKEPICRGENCIYLDFKSDTKESSYGMQGPAFHLQNLVKWKSPKRHLSISVDLVPSIVIYDENFAELLPVFFQGCPCEEHLIHKPDHYTLVPIKSREIFLMFLYSTANEDLNIREDKKEFIERYFMVSLSDYERNLMKILKCKKSIYHNWFICYQLMKCFGNLDHNSDITIHLDTKRLRGTSIPSNLTIPERNESFTSYTWKTLIFGMASQEKSKLTLKQCFDRLTAMFDKENRDKSNEITVNSFWWPLVKIPETIHLDKRDSNSDTPFVNRMLQLKVILNELVYDSSYNYLHYKDEIMKLFPDLSKYFKEGNDCKSNL